VAPCNNPPLPLLPSRTTRLPPLNRTTLLLLLSKTTPLPLRLRLPLLLLWLALAATLTRKYSFLRMLFIYPRRSSYSSCSPSIVARAATPRVATLVPTNKDLSTPTCSTSGVETVEGVECRALVLLTPVTLREIATVVGLDTVVTFFYSRPPLERS
jgi:hypothetical protein